MQSQYGTVSVYPVDDFCGRLAGGSRACLLALAAIFGAALGWLAWPHAIWLAPLAFLLLPIVNTSKSAHGPWRLSKTPALALALPLRYFETLGVPSLAAQ